MRLPSEFYTLMNSVWPMLLIFSVVLATIRIFYIIEKKDKFVLYKEVFTLIFIIYFLMLFSLVTNTDVHGGTNNFMPFHEILRYKVGSKHFMWNIVGNIAIFIPFGYIVSLILNSKKVGTPLIITFITSLTIELVQRYIGRVFDIDDIILNCVGGILGFLFYIGLSAIKKHLPKFLQSDFVYNLLTVIMLIFVIGYGLKMLGVIVE